MMLTDEEVLRLGIYSGLAAVKLMDDSYCRRLVGRNLSEVSVPEYLEIITDIQARLLAAGIIQPDEDPYQDEVNKIVEATRCRSWTE